MQTIALDVHAHLAPRCADRLDGIADVEWLFDRGILVVDGHEVGVESLYRPAELRAWMDESAVARAWVSVPPPFYRQHLTGEACAAWTAVLNDGLQEAVAPYANCLELLPHLPLADPDVAADVARTYGARGFRRFSAPTGGGPDIGLSDPAYEPLWQVLDEAGAFVFLHPGECADGRLSSFYLGNLVGNPYETTIAVSHLLFGGILERYGRITFCTAHGGGMTSAVAGRFAQGVATKRPGLRTDMADVRQLLRRLYVDCIVHGPAELEHVAQTFGEDRIVFGSDWPFPMGITHPERQLAEVAPDRLRRILQDNPQALIEKTAEG